MRVERTVYFIVSKENPIEFHVGDGSMSEDFADAAQYNFKDVAEQELSYFDEPEKFTIIDGTVGINI